MTLVVSVVLSVGVNVAVQVTPLSLELTALSVPLPSYTSEAADHMPSSLKVMLPSDVTPPHTAVAATTMVALVRAVTTT